jgi:hypothetical protein
VATGALLLGTALALSLGAIAAPQRALREGQPEVFERAASEAEALAWK